MNYKTINFDMDGTLADLYKVNNWLTLLRAENTEPYIKAKPLHNTAQMSKILNKLQHKDFELNIISWTAKESSEYYSKMVMLAKYHWLKANYPKVKWDNIYIIPYNTDKSRYAKGILFDDSETVRADWIRAGGTAYNEKNIIKELKRILNKY